MEVTLIILAVTLTNLSMALFIAWVIFATQDNGDDKSARLAALILCLILNSFYISYLKCTIKTTPTATTTAEALK